MMKVFRIESDHGHGPYDAFSRREWGARGMPMELVRHPSPWNDSLMRSAWDAPDIFMRFECQEGSGTDKLRQRINAQSCFDRMEGVE